MKKKNKLLIITTFTVVCVLYHTLAPKGAVFSPSPLPVQSNWALVPLDNRPPCRQFTEELGDLAGIHFTGPPENLMDWYEKPAQKDAIKRWLATEMSHQDGALISTDLLLFGGLLHSRMIPADEPRVNAFFNDLETLMEAQPDKPFYLYTVIPRLLINDQVLPDRWYQWHLMTWAINMDKKIKGVPYDEELYERVKAEIPMALKWKYITLYRDNDRFNQELIDFSIKHHVTDLVIGQDDAHPYGLPNYNRTNIDNYTSAYKEHGPIYTTQGADELGMLAVSRIYGRRTNWKPHVYVQFGSPKMKSYTLHFVPMTLGEIAKEKIIIGGGIPTDSRDDADYILFVHCGQDGNENYTAIADELKNLMKEKPVALVDLSQHFAAGECLLPSLLANGTPIGRLLSYSGWNTASNAIGTAVAQGNIVTGQAKHLPKEKLPSLYAQNLTFNAARFLDDWAYQKLIRPHLAFLGGLNGAPETPVQENSLAAATQYTSRELGFYTTLLTWYLRRVPFYQDENGTAYYLRDLTFEMAFPWERAFEITLKLHPVFGKSI
jgi:hypothetical protein